MKRQPWKIFINFGFPDEYEKTENVEFRTKKEAQAFAKVNGFPYRCIVTKEDYERMRGESEKIVISR